MVERSKVDRYRRLLLKLAEPAGLSLHERDALQGEAAKLGREIHEAERAGKPRALTEDTVVAHTPQRPVEPQD